MRTNYVIENVKQDGEVKKKGLKTQRKERHQRALRADSNRDKMLKRGMKFLNCLFHCFVSSFGFRTKDVCGCVLDGGWWQ